MASADTAYYLVLITAIYSAGTIADNSIGNAPPFLQILKLNNGVPEFSFYR